MMHNFFKTFSSLDESKPRIIIKHKYAMPNVDIYLMPYALCLRNRFQSNLVSYCWCTT